MDNQPKGDSTQRKKDKKKKHHRSRSESKKHKKDHGGSREHKKKDKEKKKHKSKSRSRDARGEKEERREGRVEEKRPEREKERQERKEKERGERKSRDREQKREKEREADKPREKQRQKDKEREKEKERQREKDKERQREKDKDKQREKDKEKQREKDKDKQREKDKQRQKDKEKGRDRSKQKQKERKQKDRPKQRSKQRKRDRSKSKRREERSRSRDHNRRRFDERDRRGGGGKDRAREDKYQRWRKQANFRFDSPPKSDDSDMSDDPQKVDRLNKMKAEKELVSSKADRKLYLGNLPPNITSNQLMQMLNSALKKMEINCEEEGDSIVSAWISPDGVGHYAFVQFRTAQEATAGLALNGASLYGYQLKLGRPKQYIQYHKQLLSQFGSDGNIDTILRKVQAMGGFTEPPKIEERLVSPPSRVVVLKSVVTVEELAIDEEYNEIVEDVTEMAKRHGDVLKVVIPRPMEIDLEEVKKRVKGLGFIFIKYRTVQQGKYARKELIKQMFSDRSVACGFFPQSKLEQGELDVIDRVIIDF